MTPKHPEPRRPRPVEALEPRLLFSSYMVTNLADSGPGSLRADILMSNASPGANTITFAPGLTGTITLTTGQLEIASDLTIIGPGASSLTISGNNKSRVFQVDAGATASITGLTITGGRAPDGAAGANGLGAMAPGGPGGGGGDGGGIYNLGTLTLSRDVISGNVAGTGGAGGGGLPTSIPGGPGGRGGRGGGIFTTGPLTIANCTIKGNQAGNGGAGAAGDPDHPVGNEGGLGGNGGGIYGTGAVTIMDSIIQSNKAGGGGTSGYSFTGTDGGDGGGMFATGPLTIFDSTIDSNVGGFGGRSNSGSGGGGGGTGGGGGGIDASGDTTVVGSTISRNSGGIGGFGPETPPEIGSGGPGGGILASGPLTLTNCTIGGNSAGPHSTDIAAPYIEYGGGIDSIGVLHLTNCTVSGNGGIGGGLYAAGDALINNTIVAGNVGYPVDVGGALDPAGAYNLIGDGTGMTGLAPANHNQIGTHQNPIDPKVAPLGDNGGPTQTMAPSLGGPAIDAGSNALALGPDGKPLLTDQRGYGRVFNGIVDIGAYEYGSSIPGDANGDGVVDFKDLLIVGRHYGQTAATWTQGDFNGDGSVGFDDLVILARNYGQTTSTSQAASVFAAAGVGADASVPGLAEQQPAGAPQWLSVSRRQAQRRGHLPPPVR